MRPRDLLNRGPAWSKRFRFRGYFRESIWIMPCVGAVIGVGLAQLSIWLDAVAPLPEPLQYSAGTTTSVLAAIVGAMISLIGFVVTISVLVIQMATGNLSPRVMRLFYRSGLQKVVLALFMGTLTLSLALLRRIDGQSTHSWGVTLAGAAVAVSMVLFLVFLDRFAHLLRPVAVAAFVSAAGRKTLLRSANAAARRAPAIGFDRSEPPTGGGPSRVVRSTHGGAIQAISSERLVALARRHDCVLVMHPIGDFVPAGGAMVEVFGGASGPAERALRECIALGRERTVEQDPAFALRIMVDIAIRALSAAVNDPTTACQVVDYIEDFLRVSEAVDDGAPIRLADDRGHTRVVIPVRRWDDYLTLGVTEIREYGARSTQVARRLRAMLEELRAEVRPAHRRSIDAELSRLEKTVEGSFAGTVDADLARERDVQGVGGPRSRRYPR
jgi:uncharacterized membrane protein